MIRYAVAVLSYSCLFAASALAQDDLLAKAQQQFEPIPTAPPELPGNVATPAKVELGKMLYFDPRLSASHAISCSSCHSIGLGGADAEPTSIGHRWQHGGRNAPTVLNAVFNKVCSSGTAGPKTSNSRLVGRWLTRSRWRRLPHMWPNN